SRAPDGDEPEPLPCTEDLPYATEVVSFTPGLHAGFGQLAMPEVVLGPPSGDSLDVVSLGVGGEIVVGLGDQLIVDGPGADFIIWENTFWIGGDASNPYAELGEVTVSEDGETWVTFPCDETREEGFDPGCAGWRPRLEFAPCDALPLDPDRVGGDPFDLADIGVERIRYIRVRDLATDGAAPSAGFDLDAVGGVHFAP
ncbi:MAG: cell surface protein, partial [Myxococcota bacterium]|nr:cell surface protein [Myxococcota bacterium]